MIFILTNEQVADLMKEYGVSKKVIDNVQKKINLFGVIANEEDYFSVVSETLWQKETLKDKQEFMTYDDIIKAILKRKFDYDESTNNIDYADEYNKDSQNCK